MSNIRKLQIIYLLRKKNITNFETILHKFIGKRGVESLSPRHITSGKGYLEGKPSFLAFDAKCNYLQIIILTTEP